jgi:hypothetical protein
VIRIHGSRSTLEQAVIASSQPGNGVRSFVRKWRSLGETKGALKNPNNTGTNQLSAASKLPPPATTRKSGGWRHGGIIPQWQKPLSNLEV